MRHCATSRKVAGSIPNYVIRIFHLGAWIDLASNKSEYKEYFLEVKDVGA